MHHDTASCLRAVRSKDRRFDGWFYTAVRSTRIYCRPSCPAMTPKSVNMTFYPSAAAAQAAGYRACKRCRPDASPGSPEWNQRADLVARAVRLIADGVIDRDGVPGLANRLGYSVRQLERQVFAEMGAGPLALARASRAQTARLLIESTDIRLGEVAFAAGFASVRTFNDTVRQVYGLTPSELRARRSPVRRPAETPEVMGTVTVRLPFRAPFEPSNLFGHLAATAVPGVEEWRDAAYRRTLRLPHGHAIVALRPPRMRGDGGARAVRGNQADHAGYVEARLSLSDLRDLTPAITRCRWLLDLDADPAAVDDHLASDSALRPLVESAPGRRVPRVADGAEFAVRVVLGQQVSTAAARTHAARLVAAHGERITDPEGSLTHLFPTATDLADLDPTTLAMPARRRETLTAMVGALADGDLDLTVGADWAAARRVLRRLPGVGEWTVETVAMRALGAPDAFLAGDLGVRRGAGALGLPTTPRALAERSLAWRPWRAYAVQHLWATQPHAVNRLPDEGDS